MKPQPFQPLFARDRNGADPSRVAFTLMELLMVIGIMALVATIAAPSLKKLRESDVMAAANRQLLDDLASARQRAIVGRTTVYMVFMPSATNYSNAQFNQLSYADGQRVLVNQLTAYALFAERSVGDQPGQPYARYLTDWRSLPEGVFIPEWAFRQSLQPANTFVPEWTALQNSPGFADLGIPPTSLGALNVMRGIKFPGNSGVTNLNVFSIAFDYQGRLKGSPSDMVILPLGRGNVYPHHDATKRPIYGPLTVKEDPAGNSIENFNCIAIDWLTGRAKLLRQEIKP